MTNVLEVKNLKTYFFTGEGIIKAVDDVSFSVPKGKTLGLVGESGCGKSVTAMSITRLISPPGRIVGGEVLLDGRNLIELSDSEVRKIRGAQVSMIFQEPMTALNPVLEVGFQIAEAVLAHERVSRREAWSRAVEAMMAVSILELLDSLRTRYHLSLILISHDLGVIAEVAETVAVMYAGKIVEMGPAMDVFHHPKHPYTEGLLRSVPRLGSSIEKAGRKDRLYSIEGTVPNLLHLPDGCSFAPRCHKRTVECTLAGIPLEPVSERQEVRCIHA